MKKYNESDCTKYLLCNSIIKKNCTITTGGGCVIERNRLKIANEFYRFVEEEALPGSDVSSDRFWEGFSQLIHDLAPNNRSTVDCSRTDADKN